MKKKLYIAGAVVLGLAVLLGGAFAYIKIKEPFHKGSLAGAARGVSVVGREIPRFTVNADGAFTILQFTDTHFITGRGKDERTFAAMDAAIARALPQLDLVVVTGDMLDGYNTKIFVDKRAALERVAELFERRQQYWAYVPGNNDGETLGSTADVVAALAAYEHCVVANEAGLTGETQYVVPLYDAAGETVHELIFMDSLMRDPATHYITYDCFKQDQADWLRGELLDLKARAPLARASVFFHMNTPAFTAAKNGGAPYAEGYAMPDFPDKWAIAGSRVLDDAMRDAGNVGLVSIGHLHPPVNWCAFYGSAYYHITRSSGYQVTKTPGAALITIHTADGNPRRLYSFEEIVF